MKFLLLCLATLSSGSRAWTEVRCDHGSVVLTRIAHHTYYDQVMLHLGAGQAAELLGAATLTGTSWDGMDRTFDHSFFDGTAQTTDERPMTAYLARRGKVVGGNFIAEFQISRFGSSECLRYEEQCSCCYYGDCQPTCLEERNTPTVTFFTQQLSCEVI